MLDAASERARAASERLSESWRALSGVRQAPAKDEGAAAPDDHVLSQVSAKERARACRARRRLSICAPTFAARARR